MSDHDKAELETKWRRRLEAELEDLLASSRTSSHDRAPVSLDQQSVGRLARMDAMQIQAMAQASERCGHAIPADRLEVDATARFCVPCAEGKDP